MGISKRIICAFLSLAITLPMFFAAPAYSQTPDSLEDSIQTYSAVPKSAKSVSVDFSVLEKAYGKVNSFLLDLNNKNAMYNITSMQNLIDAMSDENIAVYLGADDLSGFTPEDEEASILIAENINSAYSSLQSISGACDLSAYLTAARATAYLDSDAYTPTNSIDSAIRIANILIKTKKLNYTDPLSSENTSVISSFKETATQQNVDDATRTLLDSLYVSIKKYDVITSGAVEDASFQNGTSTGETSPYTATYGSTVIAYSDIEDTAWYMDFSSDATSRTRQFQSWGPTFRAKVFANLNIYAETRSEETPNMVRILRSYSNIPKKSSIQAMNFVDSSFILPEAKACPNYTFSGYIIGNDTGNVLSAGDEISISGDTDIQALYTLNEGAECAVYAIALDGGEGFNDSVGYNEKIELKGGEGAYAWVEELGEGRFRPFAIGCNISFLASESINLRAVTKAQFDEFSFVLPAINMRKEGALCENTKVIFNGQIVDPNDKVREYGVLIAVLKNGYEMDLNDLKVEDAGKYENYDIIRAKSTRKVGENQFAVGINGLAGKDYIYKGYLIFEKTNGEFITVYSD